MYDYDVLIISDFRLPGGTNHSTAQELAVHKSNGLRTGLVQSNSRLTSRALPWASVIIDEIVPGQIEPVPPGANARARVALLRHPIAVESMPELSHRISVDSALVVANQPALKPDGTPEYDAKSITGIVRDRLGVSPKWAPIGPVVRRSLETQCHEVDLLPYDWTNIFAQQDQIARRAGFDVERPKIGRHSRPQPAKWPDSADDLLRAYPDSDAYEVRILGGAKPAFDVLGRRPKNWRVYPFGALDPVEFLRSVDFWVYFHHPEWSEAYGRAIMEALRSGAVAILPEYLRVTYGGAAVYGRAEDVTTIIDEFRSGERSFVAQSARGQDFAEGHSPSVHIERITGLIRAAGGTDGPQEPVDSTGDLLAPVPPVRSPSIALPTTRRAPSVRYDSDERPRALFLTSNGAGMGHLTRMLGLAREVAKSMEPVFFSMSQGLSVVANAGFPYEYVPFNSALQTKSVLWHDYFESRLLEAIDHYQAEIIVFDGTWPYRGMLSALDKRNLLRVWVRRAMWKPTISPEQLSNAAHFDLVIEPGEHAHTYDIGATTQVRNAAVVGPMTVLSSHEPLSRSDALKELGLPDGDRYALVTLGAGNINDVESTQTAVLAAIEAQKGWKPILTKAPIVSAWNAAEARTISTFPLARYTHAFDFAVSAAGYNSFSEWMSGGLPTVWIPNMSTMTDDQAARARWAADSGYGLRAEEGDKDDIARAVTVMCNDSIRGVMERKLNQLSIKNGVFEAASLIEESWKAFDRQGGVRR